jgi:uncharacterized RDD family membrane protein YckC
MAQSCPQCGSVCRDDLKTCAFCDSPLIGEPFGADARMDSPPSRPAFRNNSADPPEPEWRREMARKLDAYRQRRRGGPSMINGVDEGAQPALPFIQPAIQQIEWSPTPPARLSHPPSPNSRVHLPAGHAQVTSEAEVAAQISRNIPISSRGDLEPTARPARAARAQQPARLDREQRHDRMEISVSQPSLDFTSAEHRRHPESRVAPVSATAERIQAGLLDIFFLVVVYAGFLLFFHTLGGRMDLTKTDAGIFAASFLLLYASYFALFMIFGAATPGMLLIGLTVVQIDGAVPATGALAWRSAAYVLSGATASLGFLWAIWDEDHLTWHDRISQTYITHASANASTAPFANAFSDDD